MARETKEGNARQTRKFTAAERKRRALELRRAGASYEQIADQIGYANRGGAHKAVTSALKTAVQEQADELRTLECERLDRLLLAVWKAAIDGDLKAIDRALRIQEQRARLLGLNLLPGAGSDDTGEAASTIDAIGEALSKVARAMREPAGDTDHVGA
jgi:hypothetical protein